MIKKFNSKIKVFILPTIIFLLALVQSQFAEDSFILLEWEPNPGAEEYLIELSDTKNFNIILFSTKVKDSQLKINLNNNYKYGRVAGIDKIGAVGSFSKTFEIQPRIVIPKEEVAIPDTVPVEKEEESFYTLKDKIILEASEENSIIYYQLNFSQWKKYVAPFTLNKDGENEVYYYSIDRFGNKEDIKKQIYMVDVSAPEIKFEIQNNFFRDKDKFYTGSSTTFLVEIVDGLSGIKTWDANFDVEGKSLSIEQKEKITIPDEFNGKKVKLLISAIDKKGNSSQKVFDFFHDLDPPNLTILKPTLIDGVYAKKDSELEIYAKDMGVGLKNIMCSINDSKYEVCPNPFPLNESGEIHLKVKAEDWLGNSKEIESGKIVVLGKERINTTIKIQSSN